MPEMATPGLTWAERMHAVRRLRGWSRARLAEELASSRRSLERWEQGGRAPPPPVRRLLELLEAGHDGAEGSGRATAPPVGAAAPPPA